MAPKKLGVAVRDLGGSDLNWRLFYVANQMVRTFDVTVFYQELMPSCVGANFATMPLYDAWGYDGPLIATTLSTAKKVASFPRASDRLFYVWDLEWLRMPARQFEPLQAVYADPRLSLVARCDEHAKLIEDAWGRPVKAVINNIDLWRLREVLR